MTYNEIMQKPGRRITTKVYYYEDGVKIEYTKDEVTLAKPFFNAKLLGTVMKGFSCTLKHALPDTEIYFENTAKYGSNAISKVYGPYYLQANPTYNADSKEFEHTCYDWFVKTMIDYKPIAISYPCTVFDFFQRLCVECGLTTTITSLPNGSRIIDHDIYDGINFTYRDVYDDIGQATGTLFKLNGKIVEKCTIGSQAHDINDDILKNQNIELGEHYGPINSIVLKRSGESDGIYKRNESLSSWCEYVIKDNQLMNDNNRSDYLEELYNALNGIEYDIFDLELVGYGIFEPLDKLSIITNGKTYNSYIFNNEEEFTQGYKQVIYTEKPEQSSSDYKVMDTTDKKLEQAYIIVNKQTKIIQALAKQVTDMLDCIKEISNIGDNLKLENTPNSHGAINKLSITGFTLHNLYPNMTYPSKYTQPGILNFYTLIFSNEEVIYAANLPTPSSDYENKVYNIKGISGGYYRCVLNEETSIYEWIEATDLIYQEIYINSPIPLNTIQIDGINYSDELLIEDNNVKIIQNIGLINNEWVPLTYPKTYKLDTYTIPTYDGDTYITFKYFKSLNYECKFLIKNDMTSVFATQVETIAEMQILANQISFKVSQAEVDNSIKIAVEGINLEVAKKVNSDDIISSINMSPETIKILASKLEINASDVLNILADTEINMTAKNISITADNFSVDKSGNMSCNNATMKNAVINGGNMKLANGATITGENGLITNLIYPGYVRGAMFNGSGDYIPLGQVGSQTGSSSSRNAMVFAFKLPDNFTIKSAKVHLIHAPISWTANSTITGYSRDLNLYKITSSNLNINLQTYQAPYSSAYSLISDALNFTGSTSGITTADSADISSQLSTSAYNQLAVLTSDTTVYTSDSDIFERTGGVVGYLEVIGYTNFS